MSSPESAVSRREPPSGSSPSASAVRSTGSLSGAWLPSTAGDRPGLWARRAAAGTWGRTPGPALGLAAEAARRRELARRRRGVLAVRAVARQRHPSARRWRPDRVRLVERLADLAGAQGATWPRVAAAMVVMRGIAGDDPATFARRVGIPLAALERLEAGRSPCSDVPARLRAVGALVDWAWVEAGAPASPPRQRQRQGFW